MISKWIPNEFQMNSKWIPNEFQMNSKWFSNHFQMAIFIYDVRAIICFNFYRVLRDLTDRRKLHFNHVRMHVLATDFSHGICGCQISLHLIKNAFRMLFTYWFQLLLISNWFQIEFELILNWFPIDFQLISNWFWNGYVFSSFFSTVNGQNKKITWFKVSLSLQIPF